MKSLIIHLFTISAFMCILTSCEKESNVVPNKFGFEGEWLWVETKSGWSLPMTPESLGYSLSLKIDHTTYTLLVNDAISSQWIYEFKTDTNSFGTPIDYILLETGKRYDVKVDSDSLELSDHLIDGGTWYYVKK